jgi:hypothetical protein
MLVDAGINANIKGGLQPETAEWANKYIEENYAPPYGPAYLQAKAMWNNNLRGGKMSRSRRKRKIGTRRLKRKSTWK